MTASTTRKKQDARAAALEREQRQRTIRIAAIVIVAVFVVGGLIYWIASETVKGQSDNIRPAANPAEQIIADEGRSHVDEGSALTFQHYPPSSGSHYPVWLPVAFYDQPQSEGYWVHNLEHGQVVALYNCTEGQCDTLKSQLREVLSKAPLRGCDKPKMVVVPYSRNMATPIVLVAWDRQLDLAQFDEEAILNFYKRYENQGPELVGCPN